MKIGVAYVFVWLQSRVVGFLRSKYKRLRGDIPLRLGYRYGSRICIREPFLFESRSQNLSGRLVLVVSRQFSGQEVADHEQYL